MKLNFYGPINSTGYGISSQNILAALMNLGVECSLFPIGGIQPDNQGIANNVKIALDNADNFDRCSPCLKIWHQFDLAARVGCGPYYVFPFFEGSILTEKEKTNLNSADHILVTSEWYKKILLENSILPSISVIPLGINPSIFFPAKHKKPRNSFVVLSCGKWEKRKGHDAIIKAFNLAFTEKDNVELWAFHSNPFLSDSARQDWEQSYQNSKLGSKIWIMPRLQNQTQLAIELSKGDCFITLSKAEAWNLELLECMALGKSCIATNYSGHTEYCDDGNSLLINIPNEELAKDDVWFHGNVGNWAKIDDWQVEQAADYLKILYKKWLNKEDLVNYKGFETSQRLTWDNTARQIKQIISGRRMI